MKRRWNSRVWTWSLTTALTLIPAQIGRTQTPPTVPSFAPAAIETAPAKFSQADLHAAIDEGLKLERERRWGEALQHYEQAVKEFPQQRLLEDRMFFSRAHYDVARRFSDESYIAAAAAMTEEESLRVLDEVFEKIQTHYVQSPNWTDLVQRGTLGFDVALTEEAFKKRQAPGATAEEIAAFRRDFQQTAATLAPRDVAQARQCAQWAAKAGAQRLKVSPSAVVLEYACGAAASLDEYSSFLTGAQLDEVFSQIEGNFVGLGVELKSEEHALLVMSVIAGGPAERGGLKAGDRITSVEGRSLEELNPDTAADMLRGEEGTQVSIGVNRGPDFHETMKLVRQRVDVPCVENTKIIDQQLGIGYFKLTSFQKTTAKDVDNALWKLHRDGMKSLIIDLRGNPGGLLNAAVELADKFIFDGPIVTTRGRNPREDYSYTGHTVGTWRVPLVVLIDGDSASASEIFAGAIRDRRRGTIVGQRSYGKGSVQGIFPLATAKYGIRLTTAKFFSPSGQAISRNGVTPDVAVRVSAKPTIENDYAGGLLAQQDDAILNAGLQVARDHLSKR